MSGFQQIRLYQNTTNTIPGTFTDITSQVIGSATDNSAGNTFDYDNGVQTVTGLSPGTTYYFWVEFIDASNNSGGIQSLGSITTAGGPTAPSMYIDAATIDAQPTSTSLRIVDLVNTSDLQAVAASPAKTFYIYAKFNPSTVNQFTALFTIRSAVASPVTVSYLQFFGRHTAANGTLFVIVDRSTNPGSTYNTNLEDANFANIDQVYDGTSFALFAVVDDPVTNTCRLYVDGILRAATTSRMSVMQFLTTDDLGDTPTYDSTIDTVNYDINALGLLDYAMTPSEIQDLKTFLDSQ